MSERRLNRIAAILMIGVIMFWNLAPIISYAGTFIKPGAAMSTGQFMTPGKAITGGTFIVPGQIYELGQAMEAGKIGATSGKPIFPGSPYQTGIFMIPNAPPPPPNNFFWDLRAMEIGNPLQSGASLTGGTHALGGQVGNTGQSLNAGQVGGVGQTSNGGQVGSVGQVRNNGQTPNQGQVGNGGQAPNNGQIGNNGQTPNGGQSGNNGQLLNGNGSEENSGQVPIGGQVGNGNQIVNGNGQAGKNSQLPNGIQIPTDKWFAEYIPAEGNGRLEENGSSKIPKAQFGEETTTSLGKILFQSRDDSRGIFGHVKGVIVDAQNYLFSFLNKDVAGPVLAKIAGFDVKPMPNGKSGYAVTIEKNKYSNKLLNNIYQDYKRYYDGETKSLGVQTKQIREKTFNTYFNSKNFRPKGMNPVKYWAKSMITAVNDAWNPFTKKIFTKKGLMDGTAFNKGFWSGSNIAKLGGPLNVILSSANSLFDYSKVGKHRDYGYKSTEFAADLSVELAIGVGTTALGSVASSIAIGAAAGSVVPVAGTIAGAVAGLFVGLGSNYLINGTRRGIRIKNRVKKAANTAFEIGVNAFKKGVGKLGEVFGF